MNGIVIDGSGVHPLPEYRDLFASLVTQKPAPDFGFDPSTGFRDLVPSIGNATGKGPAKILEIVAHGSPTSHYGLGDSAIGPFARALQSTFPAGDLSAIFLTGCNTGLFLHDYCIAKKLAAALPGVAVFGAKGWVMKGTAIRGDARTQAVFDGQSFGGAQNADFPCCYERFFFTEPTDGAQPWALLDLPRPPYIDMADISDAITQVLRFDSERELPPLLIGPEVSGVVMLEDGPFAYELLLNGTVLRDQYTRKTYDFPIGRELYTQALR